MKQGRAGLAAAVAAGVLAGVLAIGGSALAAPAKAKAKEGASARQFTGYVTAIDKSTITVEKRGKQPRTLVFAKHDEMKSTGDVEQDARVTVYYRDKGGQLTAHRVVAKPLASRGAAGTAKRGGSNGKGGK